MSKIQKALGRLRSDGQIARNDSSSGPGIDQTLNNVRHDETISQRRQLPRRHGYVVAGVGEDEQRPKQELSLDLAPLGFPGAAAGSKMQSELLAQQFRRIKRPVLNLGFGQQSSDIENANVIMMASALPKSGKTFCSVNLAASIARERDLGAILVDADVLKPNITRAVGLQEKIGLIDFLLDPKIAIDDVLIATNLHDIYFVPAGRPHEEATELLASKRMQNFVSELSQRFRSRAIVMDTPPLLLTNEAHVLAEHAGQIILVVEAGSSTQDSVMQALEALHRDKPINVILNKARGASLAADGDYGYGGGYYGYYGDAASE
jgi:exopolysaccharide/PEP-CTERM locus tyrosine autokinase